jgi:capsular polysaccharide biosynthesis protein
MDLLALFTVLRRHPLIVVVVTLLTGGGLAFVAFGIPPRYEAQAQYVLIAPPAVPTDTEIQRDPSLGLINTNNPYLRLPNPSVVVDILAQRVSGETVRRTLVGAGADRNYLITSTNAIGSGLVINVTGTGRSAAEAGRTLELVSARARTELHDMQTINGASEKYLFQALPINPPTRPRRLVTGTFRSLVAVAAAGVVLLFALISLAEATGPRRRGQADPDDREPNNGTAAGPVPNNHPLVDRGRRGDAADRMDSDATMVLRRDVQL